MKNEILKLIEKSKVSTPPSSGGQSRSGVSAGSLYIFDLPVEVPVQWCAAFQHPDDDQIWFAVPGDEFSLVGTKDVEITANDLNGPLNLRCQFGVWIHADEFAGAHEFGKVDSIFVEQVRDRLSRMVKGGLPDAAFLVANDGDPDYLEWTSKLAQATDAFQNELEQLKVYPSVPGFSENWSAGITVPEAFHALAADASELGSIPSVDSDIPTGAELDYDGAGNLVAMKYRDGLVFQLFHHPAGNELPRINANGVALEWEEETESWLTTGDIIRWDEQGQVQFSIDDEVWLPIER